jgi:hypothetical protein
MPAKSLSVGTPSEPHVPDHVRPSDVYAYMHAYIHAYIHTHRNLQTALEASLAEKDALKRTVASMQAEVTRLQQCLADKDLHATEAQALIAQLNAEIRAARQQGHADRCLVGVVLCCVCVCVCVC